MAKQRRRSRGIALPDVEPAALELEWDRFDMDAAVGPAPTVPAAAPTPRVAPVPVAAAPPEPRPRLLVIDPQPSLRRILGEALGGDYEVLGAADGSEARSRLERERVDLLLVDAALPDGDGAELCAAIRRARLSDAPTVLMSALARPPEELEAMRVAAGAITFLEKPFRLAQLRELIPMALATGRRPGGPAGAVAAPAAGVAPVSTVVAPAAGVAPARAAAPVAGPAAGAEPGEAAAAEAADLARRAHEAYARGAVVDALALSSRAVELQPDDGDLRRRQGVLLALCGRDAEARTALEAAVALAPAFKGLRALAAIHERFGDAAAAAAAWERALPLAPDEPTWRYVLGKLGRVPP